mmetsp:Transcript_27333/g.41311  ORF Transcript_27333/g.41311 Transcript_27333/m.41311 type:complete len:108 (-) Transcript_27333:252-575(-)
MNDTADKLAKLSVLDRTELTKTFKSKPAHCDAELIDLLVAFYEKHTGIIAEGVKHADTLQIYITKCESFGAAIPMFRDNFAGMIMDAKKIMQTFRTESNRSPIGTAP